MNFAHYPIDITGQVQKYREFLNISWNYVYCQILHHHDWNRDSDFLDDWMQINWEILVERELLGVNQSLSQLSGIARGKSFFKPGIEPDYIVIAQLDFGTIDIHADKINPNDRRLRLYGFLTSGSGKKFEFGENHENFK